MLSCIPNADLSARTRTRLRTVCVFFSLRTSYDPATNGSTIRESAVTRENPVSTTPDFRWCVREQRRTNHQLKARPTKKTKSLSRQRERRVFFLVGFSCVRTDPKNPRFYPLFAPLSDRPDKERLCRPTPQSDGLRNALFPNLRFPRFYVAPCVYIYIGYSPYFQRPPRDRNSVESTNVRDRHISTLEI